MIAGLTSKVRALANDKDDVEGFVVTTTTTGKENEEMSVENTKCFKRNNNTDTTTRKGKQKTRFILSTNDEAIEDCKFVIPLDFGDVGGVGVGGGTTATTRTLYLLKTNNNNIDQSFYEFPSYEQEPEEILHFISKMDKRRNAVFEESPRQVYETLNLYAKVKKLEDIIL